MTLLAFGPKAKNLLQNVNHPVAICTRRKLETFSTFEVSIGLITLGRPAAIQSGGEEPLSTWNNVYCKKKKKKKVGDK